MKRFSPQDVRDRIDIADFVGEYVELKGRGNDLIGKCPFHQEKTASFHVHPSGKYQGTFKCFGCGVSGDVLTFLMKIRGMGFKEALETLASRFGVDAKEIGLPPPRRAPTLAAAPAPAPEAPDIDRVLAWSHRYYRSHKAETVEYMTRRRRPLELIEAFGLGYSSDSYSEIITMATRRGAPLDALIRAGVVAQYDGVAPVSRFRDRLMVPIRDERGRLVSFAGRRTDDAKEKKWVNGPGTDIFTKGDILFGLDVAAPYIAESGTAILVEGYMDMMVMFHAGFRQAVAVMSKTLGEKQAALLAGLCDEVVVLLDGDTNSQNDPQKTVDLVEKYGMAGRIASVPDEDDPDDVVLRDGGIEVMEEVIGRSCTTKDAVLAEVMERCRGLPPFERLKVAVEVCGGTVSASRIALAVNLPTGLVQSAMRG